MSSYPVEQFMVLHLRIVDSLLKGEDPIALVAGYHDALAELVATFGQDGAETAMTRAAAAAREVFGNAAPPRLARVADGHTALTICSAAEQVVARFKAKGIRPQTDAGWTDRLNEAYTALLDRYVAEQEQVSQRRRAAAAARSPQAGVQAIEDLVVGTVRREMEAREAEAPRELWEPDLSLARQHAAEIEQLREQVEGLREKSLLYCGTWNAKQTYYPGAAATHDGSLWVCRAQTKDRPGKSDAWQLAVKRGRDGRDRTRGAPYLTRALTGDGSQG
jgi:hypothetical protein